MSGNYPALTRVWSYSAFLLSYNNKSPIDHPLPAILPHATSHYCQSLTVCPQLYYSNLLYPQSIQWWFSLTACWGIARPDILLWYAQRTFARFSSVPLLAYHSKIYVFCSVVLWMCCGSRPLSATSISQPPSSPDSDVNAVSSFLALDWLRISGRSASGLPGCQLPTAALLLASGPAHFLTLILSSFLFPLFFTKYSVRNHLCALLMMFALLVLFFLLLLASLLYA